MPVVRGPPPGEERTFKLPVEGGEICVTIRQPTERQKRILFRKAKAPTEVELDGETVQQWLLDAFDGHFVRIDGYERMTADGAVPISTADDLREYGETGLMETIGFEIVTGGLTEEQKKTPEPSSAGGSAEIPASPGTAENAASKDSAPSAAVTDPPKPPPSSCSYPGGL